MPKLVNIKTRLEEAFTPHALEVIDESDQHHGHSGWRDGGGTHFRVRMRAEALRGLSRVAAQRAVTTALAAEFAEGLHALALDVGPPDA